MWPAPNIFTNDSGPTFFRRPTISPSSVQSCSAALCQAFLRLQARTSIQAAQHMIGSLSSGHVNPLQQQQQHYFGGMRV